MKGEAILRAVSNWRVGFSFSPSDRLRGMWGLLSQRRLVRRQPSNVILSWHATQEAVLAVDGFHHRSKLVGIRMVFHAESCTVEHIQNYRAS